MEGCGKHAKDYLGSGCISFELLSGSSSVNDKILLIPVMVYSPNEAFTLGDFK
jgi:hypothetical protein